MKHLSFIKKHIRQAVILALCAIVFAPAAQAGLFDDYAKFKKDPAMQKAFYDKQTLPDYNYYYTGRENLPYAVIGIDPQYALNSRFWNKIETKDMVVIKVEDLMPTPPYYRTASRILDVNGNQVGLWFSYYPSTIVKFGRDDNLTVYSPYKPGRGR